MDDSLPEEGVPIDWSYQGRTEAILRGRKHPNSNFERAILIRADFTETDFSGSNFRNCKFKGADLRGIRGRYAIWEGSDWWNAKMDDDLIKALSKKWRRPDEEE